MQPSGSQRCKPRSGLWYEDLWNGTRPGEVGKGFESRQKPVFISCSGSLIPRWPIDLPDVALSSKTSMALPHPDELPVRSRSGIIAVLSHTPLHTIPAPDQRHGSAMAVARRCFVIPNLGEPYNPDASITMPARGNSNASKGESWLGWRYAI